MWNTHSVQKKLPFKNMTAVYPPSNYNNANMLNGYIITKWISSTTIMVDWDFMLISWCFKQTLWCEWQTPEGLDTFPALFNANDTIRSFWPWDKNKDCIDAFKMLVCSVVTDCSNLAQKTCPTKRVSITAQQKFMLILGYCLNWLAGWVSQKVLTPGSGSLTPA